MSEGVAARKGELRPHHRYLAATMITMCVAVTFPPRGRKPIQMTTTTATTTLDSATTGLVPVKGVGGAGLAAVAVIDGHTACRLPCLLLVLSVQDTTGLTT